jgi:hypothetical protein
VLIVLVDYRNWFSFYLDKTQKKFDHQIIVTPNFKSTDYLYSKINLINSKIIERDIAFFKE